MSKCIQNWSYFKTLVTRNTNIQMKLNSNFQFRRYTRFIFTSQKEKQGMGWMGHALLVKSCTRSCMHAIIKPYSQEHFLKIEAITRLHACMTPPLYAHHEKTLAIRSGINLIRPTGPSSFSMHLCWT